MKVLEQVSLTTGDEVMSKERNNHEYTRKTKFKKRNERTQELRRNTNIWHANKNKTDPKRKPTK